LHKLVSQVHGQEKLLIPTLWFHGRRNRLHHQLRHQIPHGRGRRRGMMPMSLFCSFRQAGQRNGGAQPQQAGLGSPRLPRGPSHA
jgi:hypothetical protein